MILELNGHGGVGKLTIGRLLADALGARLLDNHTIYNPAFATTDFRSPPFYETVRAVRTIAFARAAELPPEIPIILTIAPGRDPDWGREWQGAIRALAARRGGPLLGAHLHCAREENIRRLGTPERALLCKLTDASALDDGRERPVLLDHCDQILELDVTALDAAEAAGRILSWCTPHL